MENRFNLGDKIQTPYGPGIVTHIPDPEFSRDNKIRVTVGKNGWRLSPEVCSLITAAPPKTPSRHKLTEQKLQERKQMETAAKDAFILALTQSDTPYTISVEVDAGLAAARQKAKDEYLAWTGLELSDNDITWIPNKARGDSWWREWRVTFSRSLAPELISLCPILEKHMANHTNRASQTWLVEALVRQGARI